ncbi:MAG: PAS domain S-box protein [Gammaproteobacteria bacterium]
MKRTIFTQYRLVWLAGCIGGLFYILDSLIDAYILGERTFTEQLFQAEPLELWWRINIFSLALIFGIYAQYLVNRAEKAARKARTAEQHLDTIVENIPLMVFIKDAKELRFVKVNKECEALTGITRDKLIGKHDHDFFPSEQAEFFEQKDREVLSSRETLDIPEEEIDTFSQGKRMLHTRKVPILDECSQPTHLLGISEDITESKQVQLAIVAEKNRAELYLQVSEAIIVSINNAGRITLINRRGCELLGRSEKSLIGKNWIDIAIPEHNRDKVKQVFSKLIDDDIAPVEYYENEIISADGVIHYVAWHNTVQKSASGEITGTLSSGIDISYRKVMEDELKMAGAVFNSTNQGVVVTDQLSRITSVNPAFTVITGYDKDEVAGRKPSHLKSGHHDRDFYQNLWDEIEHTGHWKGEIWDRRKNGEAFPSWQSISAIVNSAGKVTHYVSVFSDITPIKQNQENLDFLAHHDPLTGLPNRLMFYDRVNHSLQRCERQSAELALLFLDLDDFKLINDTYGHGIGDHVLQIMANRLASLLRKEDTVARLGGDEFLILLESYTTKSDTKKIIDKIIGDISKPMVIEGHEVVTGVSIGVAIGPQDAIDAQALINLADQAMYRAKNNGRNSFSY